MGFLSSGQDAGGRKQKINAYNVLILILLAPSSFCYGYTAAIIATTLGKLLLEAFSSWDLLKGQDNHPSWPTSTWTLALMLQLSLVPPAASTLLAALLDRLCFPGSLIVMAGDGESPLCVIQVAERTSLTFCSHWSSTSSPRLSWRAVPILANSYSSALSLVQVLLCSWALFRCS
jgi:hypothetical protein